MAPRLLSLLSSIEGALSDTAPISAVTRSADYRKGIARMTFADGSGSIVLQNFLLADGQLCVRVDLRRTGAIVPAETSIYPQTGVDWSSATTRIAEKWFDLAPDEAREESIPA